MSAYYLSTVGGEPLLSFRRAEIQLEIQKDTARYIRHSQKAGTPKEGKENGKDKDSKDSLIPGRVKLAHEEYSKLCADKINLAARLVETLARVYARLDHDTTRVIALSGEPPQEQYEVRNGYVVGPAQSSTAAPAALTGGNVLAPTSGMRQVKEVQESLRAALASDVVVGTPVLSAGQAQKREPQFNFGRRGQHWLTILNLHFSNLTGRRINTGASAASINVSSSRGHTPQARSRLANQVHPSPPPTARGRRAPSPPSTIGYDDEQGEMDGDDDFDEDQEESGDAEDQKLYCYCRKTSYGEVRNIFIFVFTYNASRAFVGCCGLEPG